MKDQQFYDNPDAALHLPKRSSYRSDDIGRLAQRRQMEKVEYLQAHGIANEADLLRTVPRNVGAHDEIGERMQKYIAAGYGTLDAIDAAEAEIVADEQAPSGDTLGAPVEELMRAAVTPDKRGSRSRSKKACRPGGDALQREVLRTHGRVA